VELLDSLYPVLTFESSSPSAFETSEWEGGEGGGGPEGVEYDKPIPSFPNIFFHTVQIK
jgi:hypothetical protein